MSAPSLSRYFGPALVGAAMSFMLMACVSGFMPSNATPQPSNACGGFHLDVVNQTSGRIAVSINDEPVGEVDPSSTLMLVEWLPPQLPLMPWTVAVTRASDGNEVGSAYFERGADQQLMVTADGVNARPAERPSC